MSKNESRNSKTDGNFERQSFSGAKSESQLQKEAGNLLTDPAAMDAFASRISVAENARKGENPEALAAMNADADQLGQMLASNPNESLLSALKEQDRGQAMDFAVKNGEVQTAALHDKSDQAFAQELRVRISGTS
ncbi:MAG: hypothetical protein IAF58_20490 [Leptolyngbya sp.]|nr:hypothetical protein [Candidatus Melainabacteria bacterium]